MVLLNISPKMLSKMMSAGAVENVVHQDFLVDAIDVP